MSQLKYVTGDATEPKGKGNKLIIHVCNNEWKWGAGFVLALSKRWKSPELLYRRMEKLELGDISVQPVENGLCVVNMIAQDGVCTGNVSGIPLKYRALSCCLIKVFSLAKIMNASIHAPRIGSGLAGGDWNIIEEQLKCKFVDNGVNVTIYDL